MMIGKQEKNSTYSYVGMIRRKDREMWLCSNCQPGRYIIYVIFQLSFFTFNAAFRLKLLGEETAMNTLFLHMDLTSYLSRSVLQPVSLSNLSSRSLCQKLCSTHWMG